MRGIRGPGATVGALAGLALAAVVTTSQVATSLGATAHAAIPPTGRITGRITVTERGAPTADASGIVAYLVGFATPPPSAPAAMMQKGHMFEPLVLPVVVGQTVAFPNLDWDTSHNVFSTDPRFNLGQYRAGRGSPPTQTFSEPGPVEIFCNIHPGMAATVLVLPNNVFATTDASGAFTLAAVPVGTWGIFAYDRHATLPARGQVTVSAGATAQVALSIDRTRFDFSHKTWEGMDYAERHYQPPPTTP